MHAELDQPISRYEKIWDAVTQLQINVKEISKDTAAITKEIAKLVEKLEENEDRIQQMFNTFSLIKSYWFTFAFLIGGIPAAIDVVYRYIIH